jgi:hypothetical protein
MSRGPGKWQRVILEELRAHDHIFVWHIFPDGYGHRQRFVYRRAAQRLAEQGLVALELVNGEVCVSRRQTSTDVSHLGAADVSVPCLQNSGQVAHLGAKDGPP